MPHYGKQSTRFARGSRTRVGTAVCLLDALLEKDSPMRGRYPSGPEFVDKLKGSPEAKQRLQVLLETLSGACRIGDACEQLDIKEARFDQIRIEALQAALEAIELKPAGRKPQQPS